MRNETIKKALKYSIATGFVALTLWAAPVTAFDTSIMLKPQSVVEGDYVRLGDLFDNLPEHKARMVISRAPTVGRPALVDATTLQRVAQNYGLDWQPASRFEQITVERAASLITIEEIENSIANELQKQIGGNFRLELASRHYSVSLPSSENVSVTVENLNLNRTRGAFSATLNIANDRGDERLINVTGRAVETIKIPVISDRLARNAVISNADLDWIDVDAATLPTNVITEATQIIGMTPRRMVTPMTALRTTDLSAPSLVQRGEMVTVLLRNGPLSLTMKGRAIDQGAKGETIRVMNPTTNRTLQVRVVDYQVVELETGTSATANAMNSGNITN